MRITGRITWEDIKGGKPLDAQACPLATAAARELPEADLVSVVPDNVLIRVDDIYWEAKTSAPLQEWVEDYDTGVPQKPRDFQLTFKRLKPQPAAAS